MEVKLKQRSQKLKKGDISLLEILKISKAAYRRQVDDKSRRAKIDIVNCKITVVNNFKYDYETLSWKQDPAGIRHVKFIFLVKSQPTSYKKIDNIKTHMYPVYFLFRDLNDGINSSFRWRTGSFKKMLFAKPGQDYKKVAEANIRRQVQPQFFFDTMQVLSMYGLLYGPNTTNKKLPKECNPHLIPFFDKHAYFCATKVLVPLLLGKGKDIILHRM